MRGLREQLQGELRHVRAALRDSQRQRLARAGVVNVLQAARHDQEIALLTQQLEALAVHVTDLACEHLEEDHDVAA